MFREQDYYKAEQKKTYIVAYVTRGGRRSKYRTKSTDRNQARNECIHYLGISKRDIIEVYAEDEGPTY